MEEMASEQRTVENPYVSYGEFKRTLDQELQKAAQSFVRIGYLLKVAGETDVLKESGYKTMAEFAEAEYHLDASQTSRFVDIYDQYGDPESCGALLPKYESYGYAKLSEMLTLPEAVADAIGPEYTRSEIREIKQEVKEEQKITDLEVMMEKPAAGDNQESIAAQVLYEYFRDPEKAEQYCRLYACYAADLEPEKLREKIMEIIAPAGYVTMMARVPQKGKYMISIRSGSEPVQLVDVRGESKTEIPWEAFTFDIYNALHNPAIDEDPKQMWSEEYGQPFPEELKEPEHVVNTPSEQEKPKPKPQEKKVQVSKPKPVPKPAPKPAEKEVQALSQSSEKPESNTKDEVIAGMNPPETPEVLHGEVTETRSTWPEDHDQCEEHLPEDLEPDSMLAAENNNEPDPAADIDKEDLLYKIKSLNEAVVNRKWKTVMITEGWIHEIVNHIRAEQDRIDDARTAQKEEDSEE